MLTNRKLYFFLNVKELHEKIATFTLPLPLPSRFFHKKKKKKKWLKLLFSHFFLLTQNVLCMSEGLKEA